MRQLFDDGKGDYIELHSQTGKSETNPDKVFKQANATSWLNAVDAVQDVAETNGNLTPVERVLLNFGKRLSKMYETEIEARLRSAVDLDKIEDETKLETILKGSKVVKFGAWQNNRPVYMYLDLQDNVVIIARGQTIATAFKFDNPASDYKGVIKNFYRKWMATRLEMDNHVLYKVMATIGRS